MGIRTIAAIGIALAAGQVHASGEKGQWGYVGEAGPQHWGTLSPDFVACGMGAEQSPVNIEGAIAAEMPVVLPHWQPRLSWAVTNNGHSIQASAKGAGPIVVDGTEYELLQFHFHRPSEHAIDGKRTPMEAHFVHKAADGRLAVIGVMLQGGGKPGPLDAILAAAPRHEGEGGKVVVDPMGLMPIWPKFFRYHGSLTTPPCSEVVLWTVMAQPVKVSDAAIDAFSAMFPMDARPLQAMNRRFLLAN